MTHTVNIHYIRQIVDCYLIYVSHDDLATRPTLSQFRSFKIPITTFLNYAQFADILTGRLYNCEKACRVTEAPNIFMRTNTLVVRRYTYINRETTKLACVD